ncbi:MAG: hypothetical protein B7Z66_04885 [Chromatiales bacterium 21-64-14]|nr:MAG: hypothetical protein B7Z66_04885 [Chromatiales bacterium 21-64-14]HQU14664.1 hypothetical protein [Gammaproteobacteria bacterium]
MYQARNWTIVGLLFAVAAARLVPHVPNFTPLEAMALFGGATLEDRRSALLLPLAALFLSDVFLGYAVYGYGLLYAGMPFVYGGVALIVGLGLWMLRHRVTGPRVALAAFAAAVVFFLVSNFGVWLSGNLYGKTLDGLVTCYVAALPFFRYSLAGTLFYTVLLFGGFALAERRFPALRRDATAA